jgi:cysteine-rich repeat protein
MIHVRLDFKPVTALLFTLAACSLDTKGTHVPGDAETEPDPAVDELDGDGPEGGECERDLDCSDREPCNGEETCRSGLCVTGDPLADGETCTAHLQSDIEGRCDALVCIPLTCGNGDIDAGEFCDDANAVEDDGCRRNCAYSCTGNSQCDDGSDCTSDACVPGGSGRICRYTSTLDPCDDGDPCTSGDACDPEGTCAGTAYVCEASPCESSSVCDGLGGCIVTYDPPGEPCDDGVHCTTRTSCDGEGRCLGDLDDSLCMEGEICRPACFQGLLGCGSPPSSLDLRCVSPASLAEDSETWCEILLGNLALQAPCLSCAASIGVTTLAEDFSDPSGSDCALDGWVLLTGDSCASGYTGECTAGTAAVCCDSIASICETVGDNLALASNLATNCGGGFPEWRLGRTVDASGLKDLRLCLSVGKRGGVNTSDFLVVTVSDGTNRSTVVCADGAEIAGALPVDGVPFPFCVDLPGWADDNPAVTIMVVAHSGANGHILLVDDLVISAWSAACSSEPTTVFTETFDACPSPVITDGWNGWRVSGEPGCPGFSCPGGKGDGLGAASDGSDWTLERDVDTTSLVGDVTLCFDLGDGSADAGESVDVSFSADGGLSWPIVWQQAGNISPDYVCRNICVSLSAVDEAAAGNPALKVRFTLHSDNKRVTVDQIEVSGTAACDPAGAIGLGEITEDSSGHYEFPVTDETSRPMPVLVRCSWDDPPVPASDGAFIAFTP